jgi:ABC-type sugar transport system ATPase subunit
MGNIPLLQASAIVKSYPGVVALDRADFELRHGEVHALLGENGAGKSTLVRILTGAEQADSGEIRMDGDVVDVSTPRKAQANGIAAIYQDVSHELIPQLSVAENVYLGREPKRRPARIDWSQLRVGAEQALRRLDFDPGFLNEPVARLAIGERQTVAMAKALSLNTRVLIMDEPTASLNTHETATLFTTVRALSRAGVGIIYISHRLEELLACAHRVTVLRDGRVVGTVPVAPGPEAEMGGVPSAQQSQLVRMMVGHDVADQYPRDPPIPGTSSLILEGLSGAGGRFSGVDLTVHEGEAVGIYGITGCGNRELVRSIFGLEKIESGRLLIHGSPKSFRSPRDAISSGIAFIPDDRPSEGTVSGRSVRENITAPILRLLSSFGIIRSRREAALARSAVNDLNIKTPTIEQLISNLSGGNQQKIVFAKWLSSQARIFLFNEPTRGIDVAAKAEIYTLINRLKSNGVAILIVSSELPEVLGICDRVLVMRRGSIAAAFDPRSVETSQARIFDVASGG